MSDNNKVEAAICVICEEILSGIKPEHLPVSHWAAFYALDVLLYAILETAQKYKRNPGMTAKQITNFASKIMVRREVQLSRAA